MLPALLARLREEPKRAALMFDVDGTLAPIVPRPEDARVPDETRSELSRLARRYGFVACISGRTGADAARLVGVERIRYVGVHGLELEPEAEQWVGRLRAFAETVEWPAEDKLLTVSFHYRGAPDENAARTFLQEVATRAREAGLVAAFGRKVLEVRPPVPADKGTAVRRLLGESHVDRALYAGDDTTDIDAFRGLTEAGLELAVRIALVSDESPAELRRRADLTLGDLHALLGVLQRL